MTRKEAIDILMSANVWNDEERTALATLIPELRESEDERIINQLITLVNSTGGVVIIPTNKEELIAWLEKQKEQKPVEIHIDNPNIQKVDPNVKVTTSDSSADGKEQFEKNRLAHCDAASKEDCDRETDFAMEIIEKEHRQPTFIDAINYGMRLQKEQIITLIQSRIGKILGDAQPKPALRAELRELIEKIKEDEQ